MQDIRNKPRVFLSHSSLDKDFVNRVCEHLRFCQIEPWLDTFEIRPGQPWLDAIFESGIPTCDAVIVFFTPNSLESPVVKKEIDASLVAKLRDKHVSFLPCVSNASLREKLRSDIQALQVPEWNKDNYYELLPRVVAEIWHGFMDRAVLASTVEEKSRRLELELEIEKRKIESGIFGSGEDNDFQYIYDSLDRWETITFHKVKRKNGKEEHCAKRMLQIRLISIIPSLAGPHNITYSSDSLPRLLRTILPFFLETFDEEKNHDYEMDIYPDLSESLLMFGLIERREDPNRNKDQMVNPILLLMPSGHKLVYTPKIERFRYWMAVNNRLPRKVELQEQKESSQNE